MKINLEKLREIELKYSNAPVATNTLQDMVKLVTDNFIGEDNMFFNTKNPAYFLALHSLIDLEIIEIHEEERKKLNKQNIEQINS